MLTSLERLNLSDTGVTDNGMRSLSRMKALEFLDLSHTGDSPVPLYSLMYDVEC